MSLRLFKKNWMHWLAEPSRATSSSPRIKTCWLPRCYLLFNTTHKTHISYIMLSTHSQTHTHHTDRTPTTRLSSMAMRSHISCGHFPISPKTHTQVGDGDGLMSLLQSDDSEKTEIIDQAISFLTNWNSLFSYSLNPPILLSYSLTAPIRMPWTIRATR